MTHQVAIDDVVRAGEECRCDDLPHALDPEGTHYRRRCLHCGHVWYGLHCPHDGYQNPCPLCKRRPETVPEEQSPQ